MQMPSRGVSFIESLVALSVFSVGSGCAGAWLAYSTGLHARASRSMVATTLAVNLHERLRANPAGIAGGYYVEMERPSSGCETGCDAASLAVDDIRRFRASLLEQLGPSADGSVRCDMAGNCVIRVTWRGLDELVWPVRP